MSAATDISLDDKYSRDRGRVFLGGTQALVRFEPGVNEDLAATTIWGTQQVPFLPGAPLKREMGSWLLPVFRLLARFRFLRGTVFDPFGRQAERRLERGLIADDERLVAELTAGLGPERHALAAELACRPEHFRGFGHVKERHVALVATRRDELLRRWRAPDAGPGRAA